MGQQIAARSRTPSTRIRWLRSSCLGVAYTALAIILWQWLAAYIFLWSIHLPPRMATPLTVARYSHYYGNSDYIRHRIQLCSMGALILVVAVAVSPFFPQARSLHGAASFASCAEIAAAGLFSESGLILGSLGRRYLILPRRQDREKMSAS
jgi:type IV secretion system protein VirD4